MSFPAFMIILAAITGGIALLDKMLWASNREKNQREPVVVEYAKSFFPIILAVLVIRSFIVEPFRIPSASMLPTLHIGDFILVNKFRYGIRLPVLNSKVVKMDEPKRGDVVVFRYPPQPQIDYIKRVVGLPGDRVGYFDKTLYINGEVVVQDVLEKQAEHFGIVPARSKLRFENLADGHQIVISPKSQRVEVDYVVPEGEYFVMGDNRDNSSDSRFWGTVPEQNLVGKAFYIWMSWDCNASWACIAWDRLGDSIK